MKQGIVKKLDLACNEWFWYNALRDEGSLTIDADVAQSAEQPPCKW
jgi:hypothetical protein